MIQQSYNRQQFVRQPPSPTPSAEFRQSRRSSQRSQVSSTTLTTKIATSSPHDGQDRERVEALPDRRPSPDIHTISQPNTHHPMPPPPQHSLSQPNIHNPAHYPHRPIPRGPPPSVPQPTVRVSRGGISGERRGLEFGRELLADVDQSQQSSQMASAVWRMPAVPTLAQKMCPYKDLVRNNPEGVSPEDFIENAQTGANTRKTRDRSSQSSIIPIPSGGGSPHSRTPEHRQSPSYLLRGDSPQPYSHYDYSQARVPTPSGLRKVETISPHSNATKLSNSMPPLQPAKTKILDRSLPLQEEPEDHHDAYALHRSSPTPSLDVYPEGRPSYDLKARGGRDSAGRRVEGDDSALLNEDLSDEEDGDASKPGQGDGSSSSGFTLRSHYPPMSQRSDYHQATLRSYILKISMTPLLPTFKVTFNHLVIGPKPPFPPRLTVKPQHLHLLRLDI
jgi:hypothetical protein